MKYSEALKELQHDRCRKFILTGEETFLKERFIELSQKIFPEVVCLSFYPGEEKEIKSALYSQGIFGDQLVILRYYDEMKQGGFKEVIRDYTGHLIICTSEGTDVKSSVVTGVAGLCTRVDCTQMPQHGPEYPCWISSRASEMGYSFIDGAEDLLYQKVGPDMLTLNNELLKVALFKGESKTIIPGDVETVVTESTQVSSFDMLDALLKKDVAKALKALDLYTKNNEGYDELVSFLGNYFEKLYRMTSMHRSGSSADNISLALRIPASIIKSKYLPKAVSLGTLGAAECLDKVYNLSVDLRTSSMKKNLMERFIFSFGSR